MWEGRVSVLGLGSVVVVGRFLLAFVEFILCSVDKLALCI